MSTSGRRLPLIGVKTVNGIVVAIVLWSLDLTLVLSVRL